MTEYLVPTENSETEFVEKRSRFLGHVFPVSSEAEARSMIEEVKKTRYDARHNCWCYRFQADGTERYSDDGEPQGTAGQPMLEVFRREGVTNVCCVVTRYFGGILLGAGGLLRAYSRSAKDALDAAGRSVVRPWTELALPCPYHLFEQMKLEVAAAGGVLGETEYGAEITLRALLPQGAVTAFAQRVTELTAGSVSPTLLGETWRGVPLHK